MAGDVPRAKRTRARASADPPADMARGGSISTSIRRLLAPRQASARTSPADRAIQPAATIQSPGANRPTARDSGAPMSASTIALRVG